MTTLLSSSARKVAFAGILGVSLLLVKSTPADAQPQPKAEVLVIHGVDCPEHKSDKEIGEPPPLKYSCYKLIERKILPLTVGQASTMGLPNGRTFQITYGGPTPDHRHKVNASISKPGGGGFLPLAEITAEQGKRFHVGGFAYQGGALVMGITILP